MADAPPRTVLDRSIALLREGYRFAADRRAGADAFQTRLMGRRATVVGGRDGARLFYDESKPRRQGALPGPVQNTLFGKGAVHGLDDAEHRHRKGVFLSLLTPEAAEAIAALAALRWEELIGTSGTDTQVCLFDTAVEIHCSAVCEWAAVPAERVDARLAQDLATLVDGFGGVGPRHVRARLARRRTDRWATALIDAVRAGTVRPAGGTALQVIAGHREPDGTLLTPSVAAVELINVLRPTVAVAWFVAFTALALHEDPELAERLQRAEEPALESFAHELRRRYPFVPVLGARVRDGFTWHDISFRRGQLVLLDVYGTLHDAALWSEPERFDADRFTGQEPDPFTLIPQGGGDPATGHRCPGERVAIELIKASARLLALAHYEVPPQDLRVSIRRMPTRPRSGVVVTGLRRASERRH